MNKVIECLKWSLGFEPKCKKCKSTNLFLVVQQEYKGMACDDCGHEESF